MNRVYCILKLILLLHPPTSSADTIHPPPSPQILKVGIKEVQKLKVVQVYEYTPKKFLNLAVLKKNAQLGFRKAKKNDPEIETKIQNWMELGQN